MTDAQKRFFMPGNTQAALAAMNAGKPLPAGWSYGTPEVPWYATAGMLAAEIPTFGAVELIPGYSKARSDYFG